MSAFELAPWPARVMFLLAALASCRGASPEPPVAPPVVSRPSGDARAAATAEDEVLEAHDESPPKNLDQVKLLDRALCRKGECCVSGVRDAGTDRKGRTLVVATVTGGGPDCLIQRRPPPAAFGSGKLDHARSPLREGAAPEPPPPGPDAGADSAEPPPSEGASEDEAPECQSFAHYLAIIDKNKVRGRQLLTTECNNGYGAAGVGEDSIQIDPKARTFFHSREGGSNWRWIATVSIGLDPVRLLGQSDSSYWTGDIESTSKATSIDWEHLTREETWPEPDCEERAKQALAKPSDGEESKANQEGKEGGDDEEGAGPTRDMKAVSIPTLALPAAFTGGGWKTTALAGCSVLVDGNQNGFTLHGDAGGTARDASMRVLGSADGALFVEVTDDRWTGPSSSWIKDDHLELWLATGGDSSDCSEQTPRKPTAVQWGVRIADGATFAAFGSPEPLTGVEVMRRGSVARVRIPFPAVASEGSRFAVVYSDSDDGRKQERLIATSELTRGHGETLNGTWIAGDVTCAVKRGALAVIPPRPQPDVAIGKLPGDE